MPTVQINTCRGPVSVFDSVQYVLRNPDKTADIIGILNQLKEKARWEARYVARHILDNTKQYKDKIVRAAQEIVIGINLGPQKYTNADLLRLLEKLTPQAHLKLVFGNRSPRGSAIGMMRAHERGLISPLSEGNLLILRFVHLSNDWGGRGNNTYEVFTSDKFNARAFGDLIYDTLETIEVVHCRFKPPGPDELAGRELLSKNPEIWFDRTVFGQVCDDMGWNSEKERLAFLPAEPSLEEALQIFWGWTAAKEVLENYIDRFRVLAGG